MNTSELWSQKESSVDVRGWGATRYFSVVGEPAEMMNDHQVLNAPNVPLLGASHPMHPLLFCVNKTAGPGLRERIVTVRYQWMQEGWTPQQSVDDPLASPPLIQTYLVRKSEEWALDQHGNLIVNSAGDNFESPRFVERIFVGVQILRWERKYDPRLSMMFINTINDREIIAGGIKFPPRSILCTDLSPSEPYHPGARAIRMNYSFEFAMKFSLKGLPKQIADAPYKLWILDQGTRGYYAGQTSPSDFYSLAEREPLMKPIKLDGTGKPFDSSTDIKVSSLYKAPVANPKALPSTVTRATVPNVGTMLGYDQYPEMNFLELGL